MFKDLARWILEDETIKTIKENDETLNKMTKDMIDMSRQIEALGKTLDEERTKNITEKADYYLRNQELIDANKDLSKKLYEEQKRNEDKTCCSKETPKVPSKGVPVNSYPHGPQQSKATRGRPHKGLSMR